MSKNFSLTELTQSDTAVKKGIKNIPDFEQCCNLEALIDNVLQPLRDKWGKPIKINSGFRSLALNKAVGGAATSSHMKGEAADITTGNGFENKKLFDLVQQMGLPFDQLISEKGERNAPSWIHISYSRTRNRGQVLRIN